MLTPHQAKYIAHDLTLQHAGGRLERLSQALFNASVNLNPHQIEAAIFALRLPLSKGVLLADEVGLGKTIEAGIVLKYCSRLFIYQSDGFIKPGLHVVDLDENHASLADLDEC